jgi:hypothetical protein
VGDPLSEIRYFGRWVRTRREGAVPLTPTEAERRHRAAEPYIALICKASGGKIVIEISKDWISTYFLDQIDRPYLAYDFKSADANRKELFLTRSIHTEYLSDTNAPSLSTTFIFQENGTVSIERLDHATKETIEKQVQADMAGNLERYPEFGHYSRLCDEERRTSAAV